MDFGHQFVGFGRDDREGAYPLAGGWLLPVFPDAADTEGPPVLHGDGVGLLDLLALDRFPLEEAVNRNDTPPPSISVAERRQGRNRFAFGVDGFASAFRVLAQ